MQFFRIKKNKKPHDFNEENEKLVSVFHSGESKEAFDLIDKMSPEQLRAPYKLKIPPNCRLESAVEQHTIGTQFLIELFDQLNGWHRNYKKRPDILKMAAELMQKEVCIKGIYFFGRTTIAEEIQRLIMKGTYGDDDPPADLSKKVVRTFIEHGYHFSYPKGEYEDYARELTAQISGGGCRMS